MTTSNEKSLIAKAAEALLRERRRRWDNVHQGECITDARAVVAAVRGQIAAELSEAAHIAADELDEWDGEASSGLGGCSPGGVVRHAIHTATGTDVDDCASCQRRARAEALGATESAGEGENGGLGGREAGRGCTGETRGNE
ncbi:MAG: hypothetical protein ACXVXY_07195 [Mycobacteriaceae bacterium]